MLGIFFDVSVTIVTPPFCWMNQFVENNDQSDLNRTDVRYPTHFFSLFFHFASTMLLFYVAVTCISSLFTIISCGNVEHTMLRGLPSSCKYSFIGFVHSISYVSFYLVHPKYVPSKPFLCLDGLLTIPFEFVNDDYCDCRGKALDRIFYRFILVFRWKWWTRNISVSHWKILLWK